MILGITRLERWERAQEFGLDPPIEVYDIIQHHLQDKDYKEWYIILYYCIIILSITVCGMMRED